MLMCLKKGNKTGQKIIKFIKLYLQEIQVIHSVRRRLLRHILKLCTGKSSTGVFRLCVLYTKHASIFFSLTHETEGMLKREDEKHI